MKIAHIDYQFIIELNENDKFLLIVENPKAFRNIICDTNIESGESPIIFSENSNIIDIGEIECIIDIFNLSLNNRKALNKLYDFLKKEISSTELLLQNNEIYNIMCAYANSLQNIVDFNLDWINDFDILSLLKFINIKFKDDNLDTLERIIDYIKIHSEFVKTKCFVFVNLLSYLTEYEIEKLYEFCHYEKIFIILIEDKQPENINIFSQVYLIDKDYCEVSLRK